MGEMPLGNKWQKKIHETDEYSLPILLVKDVSQYKL